jgi:hypothetical protein
MSRLKKNYEVSLYNLRNHHEKVEEFQAQGYDVNDGMIVILDKKVYFGHEAVHIIAALSNKNKWIGKVYYFFFSRKIVIKLVYPLLRFGRNITLRLMGRKKI